MSLRKNSEVESIQGDEGTSIKQFFDPHNTLEGIGYSLAQFTLEPGKKSKLHMMRSSEIYYTRRSEEHTSELSHTVISYAVFCLKKKKKKTYHII